jgi:hypothetical protein
MQTEVGDAVLKYSTPEREICSIDSPRWLGLNIIRMGYRARWVKPLLPWFSWQKSKSPCGHVCQGQSREKVKGRREDGQSGLQQAHLGGHGQQDQPNADPLANELWPCWWSRGSWSTLGKLRWLRMLKYELLWFRGFCSCHQEIADEGRYLCGV